MISSKIRIHPYIFISFWLKMFNSAINIKVCLSLMTKKVLRIILLTLLCSSHQRKDTLYVGNSGCLLSTFISCRKITKKYLKNISSIILMLETIPMILL